MPAPPPFDRILREARNLPMRNERASRGGQVSRGAGFSGGGGIALPPHFGGGGGGQSGGTPPGGNDMDPWQASVEQRLDSLDRKAETQTEALGSIRADLGEIKGKLPDLPTKWFVVLVMAGTTTVVGGLLGILFTLLNVFVFSGAGE